MKTTSLIQVCETRKITLSRACHEIEVAALGLPRQYPVAIRRQKVPPLLLFRAQWWLQHRAGRFLKGPVGKLP